MEQEQVLMWYFIIGLLYALINGLVRKIDTDGDYLLSLVWMLLWPITFLALGIIGFTKLKAKTKKFLNFQYKQNSN